MKTRQTKKQNRKRTQPLRLTKQGELRNNPKARQCSKCLVYKLNQRSTEAALIYSANAEKKRLEGYLAILQAPSIVYKANNKLSPQQSRQIVEEVNPLYG